MSAATLSHAERRRSLVERAAAERESLARQLAPLTRVDDALARLDTLRPKLSAIAIGAGLGLTALLLVVPGTRGRALRIGVAAFQLAGSVKRLLSRG